MGLGTTLSVEEKRAIIQKNGGKRENILGMLLDFQYASDEGYVDEETAAFVAEELGMTETRVYEILSYYAMLETTPQAKYVLMVCNNAPCFFSKSEEIAGILQEKLGIQMGKATPDGLFALQYTPCVGACDIGPVIKVKDRVFGNLDEEKIAQLLSDLRGGRVEL